MKQITTFLILLFFTTDISGQQTISDSILSRQSTESNFLKQQLSQLTTKITKLQQDFEDASTPQKKNDLIQNIEKRQIESVRLSGSFVERFAQGAKASKTILCALETGTNIGELSSPFISPTFTERYDNWIDKWGKYIPAIVLPSLALSIKNLNTDQKLASIPIGITITGLLSGLNKSNKKQTDAIENSIKELQSTLDLFDLNRLVYSDIKKLKSFINSANKADSTLSDEFIKFWIDNKDLFIKSDMEFKSDYRYKSYINQAQVYMSRFQIKLTNIKFVINYVEGMIKSYNNRDNINIYHTNNADKIKDETKIALDKLESTYSSFKSNWNELQDKFYQITPDELRKLDSYYQLKNLKIQIQSKK